MTDDKSYKLLKAIVAHVLIQPVMKNGSPVMQVEVFTDEGVHIGDYVDGVNYEPGQNLFYDLAVAKRFIALEEAKPKKVPRIARVK